MWNLCLKRTKINKRGRGWPFYKIRNIQNTVFSFFLLQERESGAINFKLSYYQIFIFSPEMWNAELINFTSQDRAAAVTAVGRRRRRTSGSWYLFKTQESNDVIKVRVSSYSVQQQKHRPGIFLRTGQEIGLDTNTLFNTWKQIRKCKYPWVTNKASNYPCSYYSVILSPFVIWVGQISGNNVEAC